MLLRLPWLLSRKRLLAAVVIDIGLFSLLYTAAFLYRFGSWPGLSFPVAALVTLWMLSSYVIGRYQGAPTGHGCHVLSLAVRTSVAVSLSLGAYLAYFWVMAATCGASDSRRFLVPLLLAFAFLSSITQSLLSRVIRANTQKSQHWMFIGSRDTLNVLVNHMGWRRLPSTLTMLTDLNHLQDLVLGDYLGVLVSDFNALPVAQQQQLLRLQ